MSNYCAYCDYDAHRCGGCGTPLKHDECGYVQIGCCDDCYALLKAHG